MRVRGRNHASIFGYPLAIMVICLIYGMSAAVPVTPIILPEEKAMTKGNTISYSISTHIGKSGTSVRSKTTAPTHPRINNRINSRADKGEPLIRSPAPLSLLLESKALFIERTKSLALRIRGTRPTAKPIPIKGLIQKNRVESR